MTTLLGEVDGVKDFVSDTGPTDDWLASKLLDWQENKTIWHATDAIGAALVLNRLDEVQDAANFVMEQPQGSVLSKRLASRVLQNRQATPNGSNSLGSTDGASTASIHTLRSNLAGYPLDPISWVDLALRYTNQGRSNQAGRAIKTALQLAPTNRFVLRSAARFYVHQGELDRAHAILKNAASTQFDPWLLAAEIAVASAASMSPRFLKRGRSLVDDASFKPNHISELACAIATIEFEGGNARKAKKFFSKALISPTENTVAQAVWASQKFGGATVPVDTFDTLRLYEAQAWKSFTDSKWQDVLDWSHRWLDDQPFSSRPALMASYVASVAEKYGEAIDILKESLKANPSEQLLFNNLAYLYARLGLVAAAKKTLGRLNRPTLQGDVRIAVIATEGLIHFISDEVEVGRKLYMQAIQLADDAKSVKVKAIAAINWAIEEIRAATDHAEIAQRIAFSAAKTLLKEPDISTLAKQLATVAESGSNANQAAVGAPTP